MVSRTDWTTSQVAVDREALLAGDGCHHEEAKALDDYLSGLLDVQQAANKITSPVLAEEDPPSELYRLWGLLSDALVELSDDQEKILDLLAAMQSLPSTNSIDWSQLMNFGHMWSDCHRLHIQGHSPWEKESWTAARRAELCHQFEAIGTAEAKIYLRSIGGIPADWGYDVLNLVCLRRPGLEVLIFEVHAWLQCAGTQLKTDLPSEEIRSYSRPVPGSRRGLLQRTTCTMTEHWDTWRREMSELSSSQSILSVESRDVAAKCSALM
ncbi:uncharacterized protein M437DRAFT_56979 [Aureobasidium melanogenum CBS 110374]|uniref:Uncharacterized protein n=1 Tax=Aureobasidium melanogenum (strain CBS 110374) TaxID=1043003 RepID=A0A074VFE3_AURM1|nr:uncharacterized protein M437DRAFT_56979 [Aureobasidium melanogenum CBS 110374]KEQ59490.1 hypothetical protein M437DRAFT_56979 [Aureobasidium melanogenum CBS 110374]